VGGCGKTQRSKGCGGSCIKKGGKRCKSYKEVVRRYEEVYKNDLDKELEYFTNAGLDVAVKNAPSGRTSGFDKHSHQYMVKQKALNKAERILTKKVSEIEWCESFYDLHEKIDELIRNIHGVGELTVYDTAARIGANLGFKPKVVYLHVGTREGAKKLVKLKWGQKTLDRKTLPTPFRKLSPSHLEDLLCICKGCLAEISDAQ